MVLGGVGDKMVLALHQTSVSQEGHGVNIGSGEKFALAQVRHLCHRPWEMLDPECQMALI